MSNNPTDDLTVGDEEILWRRILPRDGPQADWYKRENGEWRPTSVAFLDNRSSTHSLSAYVASETDLNQLCRDYPHDNIAGFPSSIPRQYHHTIQRVPDGGYDSHVEITPPPETWGMEKRQRNRRKSAAKAMALAAQWVHYRDPV
jgi:hypothetical protein